MFDAESVEPACSRLQPGIKSSKLLVMTEELDVWARDTGSEMQLRDVRTLIDESIDWLYLRDWAAKLGLTAKPDELAK
jgi:hypothetical protein